MLNIIKLTRFFLEMLLTQSFITIEFAYQANNSVTQQNSPA